MALSTVTFPLDQLKCKVTLHKWCSFIQVPLAREWTKAGEPWKLTCARDLWLVWHWRQKVCCAWGRKADKGQSCGWGDWVTISRLRFCPIQLTRVMRKRSLKATPQIWSLIMRTPFFRCLAWVTHVISTAAQIFSRIYLPPKNPNPVRQSHQWDLPPTSLCRCTSHSQPLPALTSRAAVSSHQLGLPARMSLPQPPSHSSVAFSVSLRWGCPHLTRHWHETMHCWVCCTRVVQKLKVWFTARLLLTFDRIISQETFAQKAVTQSLIIPSAFPKWCYTPSKMQILQILSTYLTKHANRSAEPSWAYSWSFSWKKHFWAHSTLIIHTRKKEKLNYSKTLLNVLRSLVAINWEGYLLVYLWIWL